MHGTPRTRSVCRHAARPRDRREQRYRLDVDEHTVGVAPGRVLGYREYGDPTGLPVVSCHGGLVSGLDVAPLDMAARAAGVRILSPDRPGIGRSGPAPGRCTADWASDVRALLDSVGIERAAVLGWSMGGQYALACGALLADRITRVVVVAGALPLDDPRTFAELNAMDRRLTRLANRRPRAARAVFASLGLVPRLAPRAWTQTVVKDLPADEAVAVRSLSDPGLARAAAAALAHPAAMVEEYRAWARPWGFDPGDVQVPTTIWQGTADTLVPSAWGAELARRIPESELVHRDGEGHFVGFHHQAELLGELTGS